MLAQVVNLSSTDWIIISALAVALVTLAAIFFKYILKSDKNKEELQKTHIAMIQDLHDTHRLEQRESLTAMITAMAGNTKALEGNTKVMDEMKTLVHTVKDELMGMKK